MIGKYEKSENDSPLAYCGAHSDCLLGNGYIDNCFFIHSLINLFFQKDVKKTLDKVAEFFKSYAVNENTPRIDKMEISAGMENKAVIMNFYDKPSKNSKEHKVNLIIGADVEFLNSLSERVQAVKQETGADIKQIQEANESKTTKSKIKLVLKWIADNYQFIIREAVQILAYIFLHHR